MKKHLSKVVFYGVAALLLGLGVAFMYISSINKNPDIINTATFDDVSEMHALLDGGADVNETNRYGQTALIYAAYKGKVDMVEALISAGAEVNVLSDKGETPLLVAVQEDHGDVAGVLIRHGADMGVKVPDDDSDGGGSPLLVLATREGRIDTVTVLVEAGANVNDGDSFAQTPLIWASWKGYPGIVDILIDGGADVKAVNEVGLTALMAASWSSVSS